METDDLLTVQEAAVFLGISPASVYEAVDEGRLPSLAMFGRKLIQREDVRDYQQRTQPDGRVSRGRPRKVNAEVTT